MVIDVMEIGRSVVKVVEFVKRPGQVYARRDLGDQTSRLRDVVVVVVPGARNAKKKMKLQRRTQEELSVVVELGTVVVHPGC